MNVKKMAFGVFKHSVLGLCTLVEVICDVLDEQTKRPPVGHGETASGRVEPIVYKDGGKEGFYSGKPIR